MESLYHETKALLESLYPLIHTLEQAGDERAAQKTVQFMYERLKVIEEYSTRLDGMASKELASNRRNLKYKVDQLKYDSQRMNSTIANLHMRITNKWRANEERAELLTQRFRANDSVQLSVDDGEIVLNDHLNSSSKALDELINHGSAVLDSIRFQAITLSNAKSKMIMVLQQLGLSSTTLRMIERRFSEDWIIFVVGCIIVLFVMFLFYRFWKG